MREWPGAGSFRAGARTRRVGTGEGLDYRDTTASVHREDTDRWEEERALWFIRFFLGREPADALEIATLTSLFGGLPHAQYVSYAFQSELYRDERSDMANVALDMNVRRRVASPEPWWSARHRPNTFVIGQPRAGTTSLFKFFSEHPDVYVPAVKETNYYSHWAEAVAGSQGLRYQDYLMYFQNARQQRVICDISPFYLSEPGVAMRLYRDRPDAKVIAILRDPIERIISKYNLDHNNTSRADFDAWLRKGMEEFAASGSRWDHASGVAVLFNCCVSQQLSEYRRYFGEQFRVYLFDEVAAAQTEIYGDMCQFLDIPPGPDKTYWEWKAPSATRPGRAMLKKLAALLLPEVKRMEAVLQRDLSHWYGAWDT